MSRRLIRTGGVAIAAAATAIALTPAAHAGTMVQWVCKTNAGVPTGNTDGWVGSNSTFGGGLGRSCGDGAGRLVVDLTNVGASMAPGAGASWSYRAPEATTIQSAQLEFDAAIYGSDQAASMGLVAYREAKAYDGDHVIDQCQVAWGCSSRQGFVNYVVNSPFFAFEVLCGSGTPGASCYGGNRGYAAITRGSFVLAESSPPTLTGLSGTTVEDAVLRGAETLTFTARDMGVGISDIEIKLGGAVLLPRQRMDTNGGLCNPVEGGYLSPVPCKSNVAASFTLDTAKAPDGPQILTATLWDAAGNSGDVVSRRVTLDNKLPPRLRIGGAGPSATLPTLTGDSGVGGTLTATNGDWIEAVSFARQWQVSDDGSTGWKLMPGATAATLRPESGLLNKFVRVGITATNGEGSATEFSQARRIEPSNSGGGGVVPKPAPKTAAELVANNGEGGDPATGKLVPSRKRTKATVDYGRAARIEGQVVDGAGRPLTGAQIDVWEQIRVKGSTRVKVISITSDKKGGYSYRPKSQSNRTVELSYSRQRGATIYQSAHVLRLQVRAGVTLRADDASIPSFGRLTLRGRVLSSDLPKQGVVVQVRARDSGRWLKVGNPRTNSRGEFTWKWKFDKVAHGVVPFQVRLLRTGDLPAMTNESRTVRVRIG